MFLAGEFETLVQRAKEGDGVAMERLVTELQPHLEHLARGYADPQRATESTADLLQEAWIRAWRGLGQFKGGPDEAQSQAMFRAWVEQIVRRVGLNARRDARRKSRNPGRRILRIAAEGSTLSGPGSGVHPAASGPTPSVNAQNDDRARLVREAIARIPDSTVQVILKLHFFDGLPLQRIADRVELSYDQVRDRYRAAMDRLERELARHL
jgi:RNA polymerase sigma-70 factor (ECF subfamily)